MMDLDCCCKIVGRIVVVGQAHDNVFEPGSFRFMTTVFLSRRLGFFGFLFSWMAAV